MTIIKNSIAGVIIFTASVYAQNAANILQKVDSVLSAPSTMQYKLSVLLKTSDNKTETREMIIYQKGSEYRLVRFTAPPSKRGISFLSLPGDIMYLYLPAFRKTRRIAGYVKHQNFAGTDFSYEDLEAKAYEKDWIPMLVSQDSASFVLALTPKKGVKKSYTKLILYIDKVTYYPFKAALYTKGNRPEKVLINREIKRHGKYIVASDMIMKNLKNGHSTEIKIHDIEFDKSFPKGLFTKRYLSRLQ